MALIHVPRPPQSAMNPDRPVNALLKAQMERFHEAEKRLPVKHHTEIRVNAIKTEGEAAAYIRAVTEAIRVAHAEAGAPRPRGAVRKNRRVIEIAAVAESKRRRSGVGKRRKKSRKVSRRS